MVSTRAPFSRSSVSVLSIALRTSEESRLLVSKNVPDYLLGKKTAVETLQKVEADYRVSAKEAGLLKQ